MVITSKTHGNVYVLIDDDKMKVVSKYTWSISFSRKRNKIMSVMTKSKNNESILLHRYLLNVTKSTVQVDHINGDRLDNRLENLRICSNGENNRNKRRTKSNTSGYKGVYWLSSRKRWIADITVDYKKIRIGSFKSKTEAAIAYDQAAIKYHGEFASINGEIKNS